MALITDILNLFRNPLKSVHIKRAVYIILGYIKRSPLLYHPPGVAIIRSDVFKHQLG